MVTPKSLEATKQFDDCIRDRVNNLRQAPRCIWCKDPNHKIQSKSKGLCSHCNRWYQEQRKLADQVRKLPPRVPRDPYWRVRWELDVANMAIELCKCDGRVRESKLDQVEPIELEHLFDALRIRMREKRKGPGLFHGSTEDLTYFSPAQRIWIWHLLFGVLSEENKGKRRRLAATRNRQETNRKVDARYSVNAR